MLNGLAFALLLTSLYVLRFRGWRRPGTVVVYFVFFAALEMAVNRYFLPPDALGPELAWVCFGISVPLIAAGYLVWRYDGPEADGDDAGSI